MRKRNIILSLILIVSACALSTIVAMANEQESFFYQWGLLERPQQTKSANGEELAFKGDTIEVSQSELNLITARRNLIGEANAEETTIAFLIQREALYNLAVKENKVATEEEIQAEIQYMKDFFRRDDVDNLGDGLETIRATGMTVDEYFDAQYELYKKDLSVGKYLQPYIDEITIRTNRTIGDPEIRDEWQAIMKKMADEYISKDNVKDIRKK